MSNSPGEAIAMDPQAARADAPRRQEVTFADGSALWLHRIDGEGRNAYTFERRIPLANGEWARVDLRQLAPDLAFNLPGDTMRDATCAIFHSLRKRFDGAGAMLQRAGGMAA